MRKTDIETLRQGLTVAKEICSSHPHCMDCPLYDILDLKQLTTGCFLSDLPTRYDIDLITKHLERS